MWERFSYYGMRALLVLYMVRTLLLPPGHAEAVIGLDALKHGFEMLVGPLGPQPLSSHIYGLYTGLVYLTPLFGGLLADRVLGQHRTVLLGAGLMAIGHFMMAFEPFFLLAADCSFSAMARSSPTCPLRWAGSMRPATAGATAPTRFLRRHQHRRIPGALDLRLHWAKSWAGTTGLRPRESA